MLAMMRRIVSDTTYLTAVRRMMFVFQFPVRWPLSLALQCGMLLPMLHAAHFVGAAFQQPPYRDAACRMGSWLSILNLGPARECHPLAAYFLTHSVRASNDALSGTCCVLAHHRLFLMLHQHVVDISNHCGEGLSSLTSRSA